MQFKLRHCCNSAATLLHPEYALDMVRPGIATYGISPSEELAGRFDLRPLMSLRTTVSQIRPFRPDVGVSYGRVYTTPGERTLAVLSIGYADGLPRSLSNRASFLLHEKRVPVVGRICMDMCMADLTDVPRPGWAARWRSSDRAACCPGPGRRHHPLRADVRGVQAGPESV